MSDAAHWKLHQSYRQIERTLAESDRHGKADLSEFRSLSVDLDRHAHLLATARQLADPLAARSQDAMREVAELHDQVSAVRQLLRLSYADISSAAAIERSAAAAIADAMHAIDDLPAD